MKVRYLTIPIISALVLSLVSLANPKPTYAIADCTSFNQFRIIQGVGGSTTAEAGQPHKIEFDIGNRIDPAEAQYIKVFVVIDHHWDQHVYTLPLNANGTIRDATINLASGIYGGTVYRVELSKGGSIWDGICEVGRFTILSENTLGACDTPIQVFQTRTINGTPTECHYNPSGGGCLGDDANINFLVTGLKDGLGQPYNGKLKFVLGRDGVAPVTDPGWTTAVNGEALKNGGKLAGGASYEIKVHATNSSVDCATHFKIENYCPNTEDSCAGTTVAAGGEIVSPYKICGQIDIGKLKTMHDKCIECVGGEDGRAGIWTAIGCIKNDPIDIVQNLIKLGLGMGGGVALIMILASGFIYSISQGDPKRTGEARDMLVAAVVGLLFIIFSVTILQFIGYSVFRIPGFGE